MDKVAWIEEFVQLARTHDRVLGANRQGNVREFARAGGVPAFRIPCCNTYAELADVCYALPDAARHAPSLIIREIVDADMAYSPDW